VACAAAVATFDVNAPEFLADVVRKGDLEC
jgi:hypothetical protein